MSETNPNPDPGTGPTPSPQGDPVPQGSRSTMGGTAPAQTSPRPSAEGSGRFAVYDTRYEKFVGGVSDKKPSSKAARDLAGHDDIEVREV